jgi:hypothetical protein
MSFYAGYRVLYNLPSFDNIGTENHNRDVDHDLRDANEYMLSLPHTESPSENSPSALSPYLELPRPGKISD